MGKRSISCCACDSTIRLGPFSSTVYVIINVWTLFEARKSPPQVKTYVSMISECQAKKFMHFMTALEREEFWYSNLDMKLCMKFSIAGNQSYNSVENCWVEHFWEIQRVVKRCIMQIATWTVNSLVLNRWRLSIWNTISDRKMNIFVWIHSHSTKCAPLYNTLGQFLKGTGVDRHCWDLYLHYE